jgi:hypothetical protein
VVAAAVVEEGDVSVSSLCVVDGSMFMTSPQKSMRRPVLLNDRLIRPAECVVLDWTADDVSDKLCFLGVTKKPCFLGVTAGI